MTSQPDFDRAALPLLVLVGFQSGIIARTPIIGAVVPNPVNRYNRNRHALATKIVTIGLTHTNITQLITGPSDSFRTTGNTDTPDVAEVTIRTIPMKLINLTGGPFVITRRRR